jgi:hypothetical protein
MRLKALVHDLQCGICWVLTTSRLPQIGNTLLRLGSFTVVKFCRLFHPETVFHPLNDRH